MQSKIENPEQQVTKLQLDDISLCFVKPENIKGIALWIPYFGGTCDTCAKDLFYISKNNYVAISIDPWMHGERGKSRKPSIRTDALNHFRKVMWQVIGLTVIDSYKVIDWACEEFEIVENIVAGGLSMGGDIAISLAGIDNRIKRVAGVASSPDWYRKGMTDVMDSTKIIDQGNPTHFSQWLCEKLNPSLNIESYKHDVTMQLEYGTKDTHILSKWAVDFKSKVEKDNKNGNAITILNSEESTHISLIQKKTVIDRAIDFLLK